MSLFSELKRRNVIRVATAYVVASWLIIQVVETILPAFGMGDAAIRLVVSLLAIAFIPILVFSWVFEITPEGIRREVDVVSEHSITRFTGKKLDRIIMVLLALALGYFAFDKFVLGPTREAALVAETAQQVRSDVLVESYGDKSIAVLPFVNMSSDPEQEYFSDGLSDTLIHGLAQVSGLRVTAKTSSFYFKGMNVDVREIARKLNVSTILEGSVQKSGNRVRITAQLIEAHSDTHLWSKSFDRELPDIFAIQDEIAREVVRALEVTLLDTEEERLAQRYQPTLEAYEQLILGRHEMAKRTAASLTAAEQHFKRAIELDPGYALAYVGLAETYRLQWNYSDLLFEESLKLRQPLVDKALELDPLSSEALLARTALNIHLQFKTAEKGSFSVDEDVRKALKLNPNYAYAHEWYSGLLKEQGRFEEALEQMHMAGELDPMSLAIQTGLAEMTWTVGRAEEALELIRQNIERTPEFPLNYSLMGEFQTQLGHFGDAQRWVREARRLNPDAFKFWRECLGFLNLGDAPAAENCAYQLSEAYPEFIISQVTWGAFYEYQADWSAAMATLESLSKRLPGLPAYDRWLADLAARQGDIERARSLMANAFPEFLLDQVEIAADDYDLLAAVVFAAILDANGETERRDALLLALEERSATLHWIRGEGYGVLDVYIHAMRDDRDQAIAALREAIDTGWRVGQWLSWYNLRQDWKLAILHQDPEFISLVDELEADIEAQRQWYEENKDKPLF